MERTSQTGMGIPSFELDGQSKWPVPKDHTSVNKFDLKDANGVYIDSYHVGDDIWIQLYTNPKETEYGSYPALIVAVHQSNDDGPISLVISYYYTLDELSQHAQKVGKTARNALKSEIKQVQKLPSLLWFFPAKR
ncbi:hypothetical protein VE03_10516 [Pseudogymnoascus sp. 23342-1-I1]|nr:hypothetical protein VE03_10516 [Pseudogymnoascus sp. 23342-1-I1]